MAKKRIIVADDDEEDRLQVQLVFNELRADVQIDFATDGSDLMSLLSKSEATSSTLFILLDLNMPKKNGREALKEIKEDPALKKIPVIVFTTAKNEAEIRKCYDLGANTYIVKPDSIEDLRKVVLSLNSYWLDTAATPS
jgi:CheY-like chemotaxis protein